MTNQKEGNTMNIEQTCSVCFRTVKTKNNRIWDHGYKNHGIRIGNCFGANKLSFEVSKEGSQKYLVFLRDAKKRLEKVIADNEINKTLKNKDVRKIRSDLYEIFIAKKDMIKKLKQREGK